MSVADIGFATLQGRDKGLFGSGKRTFCYGKRSRRKALQLAEGLGRPQETAQILIICIYIYINIHKYMCLFMFVCMYVCMYVCPGGPPFGVTADMALEGHPLGSTVFRTAIVLSTRSTAIRRSLLSFDWW